MSATLINGKEMAEHIIHGVSARIVELGSQPTLVVILVGNDPASELYVGKKVEKAAEIGINSEKIVLPEETSEDELLDIIDNLNIRNDVHGILVQMPLPKHISEEKILEAVSPFKDVDGFHPENIGWLSLGKPRFVSCTPKGVMKMLEFTGVELEGKHVVMIGRSNIVGKPLGMLLLNANCTVTMCHSKTRDLKSHTRTADIVISAIGKPKFLTKDYFKKGQIVIDIGTSKMENGKLTGDVDFDEVKEIVDFITPVPGGVGPMTIACLMENTLEAYERGY
jgi:methylenetetrahydrofolate dehydrogenase (NADP+)/methenyltetrahydrofolate cyclohydrolase